MSEDQTEKLLPVSEKNVYPYGGIIAKIENPLRVNPSERPPTKIVKELFVEAVPLSSKKDLGNDAARVRGVPEARLVYGGQDCAGAVVFEGGRIQAVLSAADGCSFGDRKNSAEAARIAVASTIRSGAEMATATRLAREQITDMVGQSLQRANGEINEEVEGGATTGVVAVISEETINGRSQVWLHWASVGDSQLILLATQPDGLPYLKKLVQPADVIEQYLRKEGFDYDKVQSLREIKEARERIVEKYKDEDPLVLSAADAGITSFLGPEKHNELVGEKHRMNLSEEVFSKGMRNVRLIACSDNVGEKIDESAIKAVYNFGRSTNARMASELNKLMANKGEDDGCLAIVAVGRTR